MKSLNTLLVSTFFLALPTTGCTTHEKLASFKMNPGKYYLQVPKSKKWEMELENDQVAFTRPYDYEPMVLIIQNDEAQTFFEYSKEGDLIISDKKPTAFFIGKYEENNAKQ